jgi:hypothetical protein
MNSVLNRATTQKLSALVNELDYLGRPLPPEVCIHTLTEHAKTIARKIIGRAANEDRFSDVYAGLCGEVFVAKPFATCGRLLAEAMKGILNQHVDGTAQNPLPFIGTWRFLTQLSAHGEFHCFSGVVAERLHQILRYDDTDVQGLPLPISPLDADLALVIIRAAPFHNIVDRFGVTLLHHLYWRVELGTERLPSMRHYSMYAKLMQSIRDHGFSAMVQPVLTTFPIPPGTVSVTGTPLRLRSCG